MKISYHHRTRGKGAEGAHIMGVVDAFRELGHSVRLISLPGSDPELQRSTANVEESEHEAISPIKKMIFRFTQLTQYMPEFIFEFFEICYNFIAYFKLKRNIDTERPDFIYERYSLFMFGGVLKAKRSGIPIVIEINDSAIVERARPLFFQKLARKIESWVFTNCDGIVFISENFRKTIESYYDEVASSVVCPNAVNSNDFSPVKDRSAALRKDLGISDKVICGFVGSFIYWHGIDRFINDIAPKLKAYPHLVLLLVGDSDTYDRIKSIVHDYKLDDQIVMTGRVPHEKVRAYIGAMDFGILPDSNEYGSPMKLFEMMGIGVPLVSPDFDPIMEVVDDGDTGWLFPRKSFFSAVEKVLELSNDSEEINRVGVNAAEYIYSERQWKNNAASVLTLPRIDKLMKIELI